MSLAPFSWSPGGHHNLECLEPQFGWNSQLPGGNGTAGSPFALAFRRPFRRDDGGGGDPTICRYACARSRFPWLAPLLELCGLQDGRRFAGANANASVAGDLGVTGTT
jgi:hypothetical protein